MLPEIMAKTLVMRVMTKKNAAAVGPRKKPTTTTARYWLEVSSRAASHILNERGIQVAISRSAAARFTASGMPRTTHQPWNMSASAIAPAETKKNSVLL